jgi:hypothetical protein
MTIGNVVPLSSFIYVYDEKGRQLCILSTGAGSLDGLKGIPRRPSISVEAHSSSPTTKRAGRYRPRPPVERPFAA